MVLCVILLFKFKLSLMITYNHTGAITMKYIVILYLSVYHPWRENWPCGSVVAGFAYQVTGNTHLHNVTEIDTKPFFFLKIQSGSSQWLTDAPCHLTNWNCWLLLVLVKGSVAHSIFARRYFKGFNRMQCCVFVTAGAPKAQWVTKHKVSECLWSWIWRPEIVDKIHKIKKCEERVL